MNRHGFTSIELFADIVHFDPRTDLDRGFIKKTLEEFGITVHSIHGAFRNFRSIAETVPCLKRTIDDCAGFSVPILVIHGISKSEYDYTNDQVQIVRDHLGELSEYGRQLGVAIALENLRNSGKENEISWNLQDHVKNFSGLGLKYCLDIGHAALNKADIYKEIDAAGSDLVTFHIHNNNGKEDSHNLPDDGLIDWPAVYAYIRKKGFGGQFVLELNDREPYSIMDKIDRLFV
jgi:sugar phosphate isomerase/epimerase